jgi:hypothetical protein
MLSDYIRQPPPGEIGASGQQVPPEMPLEQCEDDVQQTGKYSNPGGLEMEITAPAVLVGKHVALAGGDGGSGGWYRQFE